LNSLTELKQAVDSMASGIEDTVADSLQQQLSIIGEQYADKTAVISVIKMMQAIGRYLNSRRDTADKDALPVLNSLVVALEKLVTGPDLNKEQTHEILSDCFEAYKSLKSKIASQPLVADVELQDLKAVILAVDWEISEITLKTFDTVTSRMLTRLKSHKILHAYLMIIHSIGRYIASEKATAHKDSLSLLHAVFENFERIVQTPDMPLKERQQLIEKDIEAFYDFKRELSLPVENSPGTMDAMEDEIIQPALSHVKASSRQAAGEVVLLSPSSETLVDGQSGDGDQTAPALAGRKKRVPAPRDIMDDLFSGKESPADELLDAIHLANVQGHDQGGAMNMNEPTKEELQQEGIKNFTPQRMENEPIPEISDRLDAFFNLDIPESSSSPAAMEKDDTLEAAEDSDILPAEDGPVEVIVPFLDEDESFEETPAEEDSAEEDSAEDNTPQAALNRISALVKTPDALLEGQTAVDRDIDLLKTMWRDDSDKSMLVDIISCLLMNHRPATVSTESEAMADETDAPILEQSEIPARGVWGKIKSIFFK
jgi:hypothetical protein